MDLAGVIAGWHVSEGSDLGLEYATAITHRAGGTEE
jgi:hypothetical protein